MTILSTHQKQHLMAALFLSAYDNALHVNSASHYDSQLHKYLFSNASTQASVGLGIDVSEDIRWTNACRHASFVEINNYTIEQIMLALDLHNDTASPTYVVLRETPNLHTGLKMALSELDRFDLFKPEQLTEDAGWNPGEVKRLNDTEVGKSLVEFGCFYHTLIRLR